MPLIRLDHSPTELNRRRTARTGFAGFTRDIEHSPGKTDRAVVR
jgi:hypothetical protein